MKKPKKSRDAFPRVGSSGGPPVVLAHRGGSGPWRENTIEAFAGALHLGAPGVELDVRASADQVAVVVHDASIEGVGEVHALQAAELPDWVPRLGECLDLLAGRVVDIEIKNAPFDPGYDPTQSLSGLVVEEICAHRLRCAENAARVLISSFWPEALRAAGCDVPGLVKGLLVHPASDPLEALDIAEKLGCGALDPYVGHVDAQLADAVHAREMAVVVWTVNDPSELSRMVELGVDVLITDLVPEAISVVGGAGSGRDQRRSGGGLVGRWRLREQSRA